MMANQNLNAAVAFAAVSGQTIYYVYFYDSYRYNKYLNNLRANSHHINNRLSLLLTMLS
jgi:hypothetical protein